MHTIIHVVPDAIGFETGRRGRRRARHGLAKDDIGRPSSPAAEQGPIALACETRPGGASSATDPTLNRLPVAVTPA